MKQSDVMQWLKENADERGIAAWAERGKKNSGLKSYGIGLTRLRKYAKEIGRDHKLALQLWKSKCYEAKILGLLIDDPKQITEDQAEQQVKQLEGGYLSHVFASCDATLAKTKFAFPLAGKWIDSDDADRRRCGYALIYELSKKNPKGMDDEFLLALIKRIGDQITGEDMWVRESMNTALMGIGKRNKVLHRAALKTAKAIGPVEIDYGDDNSCEPLDVVKHLTSDHVKKKLGV